MWNLTAIGLGLDIAGFSLLFIFGGFSVGQSGLLLQSDRSSETKPVRIIGAILVIAGFVFQLVGTLT